MIMYPYISEFSIHVSIPLCDVVFNYIILHDLCMLGAVLYEFILISWKLAYSKYATDICDQLQT